MFPQVGPQEIGEAPLQQGDVRLVSKHDAIKKSQPRFTCGRRVVVVRQLDHVDEASGRFGQDRARITLARIVHKDAVREGHRMDTLPIPLVRP